MTKLSGTVLRGLRGALLSAQDHKIAQVVEILDQLPRRGEADALLVPLRPRLGRLRPVRPLNFDRLLFTPLNGMIMSGGDWKRDFPGIPRTALGALADAARRQMPRVAADTDARIAGHRADEHSLIETTGQVLWPAASRAFAAMSAPPDWTAATGLRGADFAVLTGTVAVLLGCGCALQAIERAYQAGDPPPIEVLEPLVTEVSSAGPVALAGLLAILTVRLPNAPAIRTLLDRLAASTIDPRLRQAAEQAVDFVVERLEHPVPLPRNLPQAEEEVRRLALLLDDLEDRSRERPTRLARLKGLRDRTDADCRAVFGEALAEQIIVPIAGLPGANDEGVAQLEQAAQSLRRLVHAARRIGSPGHYDRALQACAAHMAPRAGENAATRIDRARLMEILLGSEAARQVMSERDRAAS